MEVLNLFYLAMELLLKLGTERLAQELAKPNFKLPTALYVPCEAS